MPQIIACPFCQQQFTISEDQYAGYNNSRVTCSSCHKTFGVVEEAGLMKGVDVAKPGVEASAASVGRARRIGGWLRRMLGRQRSGGGGQRIGRR